MGMFTSFVALDISSLPDLRDSQGGPLQGRFFYVRLHPVAILTYLLKAINNLP